MTRLNELYPRVRFENETCTGGNQRCLSSNMMKRCGCGVVAATDLILYLKICERADKLSDYDEFSLSGKSYEKWIRRLRRFVPVIPFLGTTGFVLSLGLNIYFVLHGLPYRSYYGVFPKNLDKTVDKMLGNDLPVILTIGQNVPYKFGHGPYMRTGLPFYYKTRDGYQFSQKVRAHFVTIVGSDEEWYHIQSWGKRFYIRKTEFKDYVKYNSSPLLTTIIKIREAGK